MLARLIANYDLSTLLRLTPGERGWWDGVHFTVDPGVRTADYLIVLNRPPEEAEFTIPKGNTWLLLQEPAVGHLEYLHKGKGPYARIITSDPSLRGSRYVHSHPGLTTTFPDSYDELSTATPPEKTATLSWVTSDLRVLPGHALRMEFLERLRQRIPFDLYGRGFAQIENKADGLGRYRYSIAFENWSSPYYWSEKIADCFLTWTVPIYYGCPRIGDYFPEKSFVLFDPHDPDAIASIERLLETDIYEDRLDALTEARRLFLDRYQFFPFVAGQITAHAARTGWVRSGRTSVRVAPPAVPWRRRARLRYGPVVSRMKRAVRDSRR